MVATQTTKKSAAPVKPVKIVWTLKQLRSRHSDLRDSPLDVDAWQTLYRWIKPFAISGWLVSFLLMVAIGTLVIYHTPQPVPFVQEEHGMVQPLVTTHQLPRQQGAAHGR